MKNSPTFLKYFWPFFNIIHERINVTFILQWKKGQKLDISYKAFLVLFKNKISHDPKFSCHSTGVEIISVLLPVQISFFFCGVILKHIYATTCPFPKYFQFCTFLPKFSNILTFFAFLMFFAHFCTLPKKSHACTYFLEQVLFSKSKSISINEV